MKRFMLLICAMLVSGSILYVYAYDGSYYEPIIDIEYDRNGESIYCVYRINENDFNEGFCIHVGTYGVYESTWTSKINYDGETFEESLDKCSLAELNDIDRLLDKDMEGVTGWFIPQYLQTIRAAIKDRLKNTIKEVIYVCPHCHKEIDCKCHNR